MDNLRVGNRRACLRSIRKTLARKDYRYESTGMKDSAENRIKDLAVAVWEKQGLPHGEVRTRLEKLQKDMDQHESQIWFHEKLERFYRNKLTKMA